MRASQNLVDCAAPWSIGSKDFINILQPQGRQERFSSTCSCHRRTAIFERQLPARRTATRIVIKINTQLLHVLNHSHYKFHQKPFITTLSTAILISVLEPPNRELRISTVGEPLLGLSSKQSCSTALTTRRSNFIIPKDLSEGEFYFNVHVPVSLKTGKILLIRHFLLQYPPYLLSCIITGHAMFFFFLSENRS